MSEQTFSFETVACLLAVLEDAKIVLGTKHYELMAKLDGKRTHHGFQHQFRKVKARARELQAELSNGKTSASATPVKKPAAKPKATTPKKRKLKEDDEEQVKEEHTPKIAESDAEEEFFHFVVKDDQK